jgi:membrane peptidoglycan carboxypeptidase
VSNSDWPGPYWQQQDGAGSGWRGGQDGPPQEHSPWDDNAGFWRDDEQASSARGRSAPGRGSRGRRSGHAGSGRDAVNGSRASAPERPRRAPQAGNGYNGDAYSNGNGHNGNGNGRDGHQGRFSQTADDLRSRLGLRGSAGSRNGSAGTGSAGGPTEDDAFWYGSDRSGNGREPGDPAARGGRAAAGRVDPAGGRTQAWPDTAGGRDGYRGSRRAAAPADGLDEGGTGRQGRPAVSARTSVQDRTSTRGRTALQDGNAGDASGWAPGDGEPGGRGRRAGGGSGGGGKGGSGRRDSGRAAYDGPPLSRGQRFKRWLLYGSWWRHWSWKKVVGVFMASIAGLILLGVGGFFILYESTPIPTETDLSASWQSSTVYFAGGQPMGTFSNGSSNRQLLTTAQIPTVMTEAMTAAEDRGFYTEGGISVTGLLRSTVEDLFGSGGLQGGSTITMQYAKNYYTGVDAGRQASTKVKEIFIAMKLAHARSKPWIMTQYLNTVPFGGTNQGVGAAARAYFDIDLTKRGATLSVSQAAMLAAMPNLPGVFSPNPADKAGYAALKLRWKYVLTNMVRDHDISQARMNAQQFPAYTPPPSGNGESGYTGYLLNMVEQEMEAPAPDGGMGLSQQQIDTGGYRVTTTFSNAKIVALARSINAEKAQMQALGQPAHDYDHIGAVLENPKTGAITAIYGGPGYGSKRCGSTDCYINTAEAAEPVGSSFKPYVLATAVNEGMNVFTSVLNGFSPIWIPVQSKTGAPIATMLSPTSPPPGCTVPTTTSPGPCFSSNGTTYFVFNEAGENTGADAVNVAAAISSDPGFEDLAHRDGIDSIIAMAKAFGVGQNPFVNPCQASYSHPGGIAATIQYCNDLTGPGFKVGKTWYVGHGLEDNFSPNTKDPAALNAGTPGSPAIALGENPLTPIEQATTFATLANDGTYNTPHVIAKVVKQGSSQAIPLNLATRQVLGKGAAADVDWALSFDNQLGTGTAYGNVPFRRGGVIGKTGTLGQNTTSSQAWFIGATPSQDALSVALFTNDPGTQVLNNLPQIGGTPGSQGGGWPATIWNNFMTTEFGNTVAAPMFAQVNDSQFQKWIQVAPQKPKPLKTCRPGQFKHCKPGANPSPNPSTTPTCGPFSGQPCGTSSPSPNPTPTPSPTCTPAFPGGPCTSPGPTPTPSCTAGTGPPCNPGPPGDKPAGAAKAGSSAQAGVAAVEDAAIVPTGVKATGVTSVIVAGGRLQLVAIG